MLAMFALVGGSRTAASRICSRRVVACRMSTAAQSDAIQVAVDGLRSLSLSQPPFAVIETVEAARSFLDDHDAFLFDCDGVLWRGNNLLPGTVETLDLLRAHGKTCIFVTNNAAKSRAEYAQRFSKLGLAGVTEEQVVPSSFVAARWLAKSKPHVRRAFVIGSPGLTSELSEAGIETLTAQDFTGGEFADNEASASLAVDTRRHQLLGG